MKKFLLSIYNFLKSFDEDHVCASKKRKIVKNARNPFVYKNVVLLLLIVFMFSGCSLLKIAASPFRNTVSKVPESTEKSVRKVTCKEDIELDVEGRVIRCGKKYYSYEKNFSQKERKLTYREKISQFILNAKGYFLWFIVICVALSLSGFGWVIGAVFSVVRGTGRVARDLVRGISKGKRYVRKNGSGLSPEQRVIYQRGADDLLKRIAQSTKSKESKKIVNKLRVTNSEEDE